MKILFFTSPVTDYLSDPILIGLKGLYAENCIDYPKRDILYENCNKESISSIRGHGFTLYTGILKDIDVDRFDIPKKIERNYFDLIIFSDIWRQFGIYLQYQDILDMSKTIFLDGSDSEQVYPFAGFWLRNNQFRLLSKVNKKSLYFKREYTLNSQFNWWNRLIPYSFKKFIPKQKNLYPISFSIPDQKIINIKSKKIKQFTSQIVDQEVYDYLNKDHKYSTHYLFKSEDEYYKDIQCSKFGITMKRAGWDCLRHYEIAANGTVICFRNLNKKPLSCAPHGLNNKNSISYNNYKDLIKKIEKISNDQYFSMQEAAIVWAKKNSSSYRAKELIKNFLKNKNS